MGAFNSKTLTVTKVTNILTRKSKSNELSTFDTVPEPEKLPETDARLPLTTRQVFKLKKSWKGIKRNMKDTGTEMLVRLFRNNAALKNLFKNFKNLDDNELREHEALEGHGVLVMSIIDEAITNIDNVDHVIHVCHHIGGTHCKFAGFRSDLFWNMEQPFLEAVKIILGDRYSDAMDEIYKITIKFILSNLQSGFELNSVS